MRAPQRKRPIKREFNVPRDADLAGIAEKVSYVGSPEHKDFPSFAGQPRFRADASRCPRWIKDRQVVEEWLRSAIRRGAVGAPWERGFPRYVWRKENDTVFEGRLTNSVQGEYKGYPLERDEWPRGIEDMYA